MATSTDLGNVETASDMAESTGVSSIDASPVKSKNSKKNKKKKEKAKKKKQSQQALQNEAESIDDSAGNEKESTAEIQEPSNEELATSTQSEEPKLVVTTDHVNKEHGESAEGQTDAKDEKDSNTIEKSQDNDLSKTGNSSDKTNDYMTEEDLNSSPLDHLPEGENEAQKLNETNVSTKLNSEKQTNISDTQIKEEVLENPTSEHNDMGKESKENFPIQTPKNEDNGTNDEANDDMIDHGTTENEVLITEASKEIKNSLEKNLENDVKSDTLISTDPTEDNLLPAPEMSTVDKTTNQQREESLIKVEENSGEKDSLPAQDQETTEKKDNSPENDHSDHDSLLNAGKPIKHRFTSGDDYENSEQQGSNRNMHDFTYTDEDENHNGIQMSDHDDEQYNGHYSGKPPALPTRHISQSPMSITTSDTDHRTPPALPSREMKTRVKNAVPPPLAEELKSDKFREEFEKGKIKAKHKRYPSSSSMRQSSSQLETAADVNLIANRYRKTSSHVLRETTSTQELLEEGQTQSKTNYTSILENLKEENVTEAQLEADHEYSKDEKKELLRTDWTFWTEVVNDFPAVASQEPEKLEQQVIAGIPTQIRGIIWQLMTNSKSKEMEDIYNTLLPEPTPHDAAIRRDLKRTNFIPQEKIEPLYNVIKVYTIFDPEVGYTQGMAFVIAPSLLNCETEADAFGLLVGSMKNYGLRDFYLPEMPGLVLSSYQFDRIIEENSSQLSNHLNREGVRASMYATQWFLTMFAYKFPLSFVLRISDVIFVEGLESISKFAVNSMSKNEAKILSSKFDQLLSFSKEELFEVYRVSEDKLDGADASSVIVHDSQPAVDDVAETRYDVDQFVQDAIADVQITPSSLRRYSEEYKEIQQSEHQRETQYESMRIKNHQLNKEYHKLQNDYKQSNHEHESIASELIEIRLKYQMLSDEHNDSQGSIESVRAEIQQLKDHGVSEDQAHVATNDSEVDLQRATHRNTEVMRENMKLEDRIEELKSLVKESKMANRMNREPTTLGTTSGTTSGTNSRSSAGASWSGFKKVFGK